MQRIRVLHVLSAWGGGGHVQACINVLKGMHRAGAPVHLDLPRSRIDMDGLPHRTSVRGPFAQFNLRRFEHLVVERSQRRFLRDLRDTDLAWIWPPAPLEVYRAAAARGAPIIMEGINTRIANARRILEPIHAAEGLPPPFAHTSGLPEAKEEEMLSLASYIFAPSPGVAASVTAPDSAFRGTVLPTSYGAWMAQATPPDRSKRTGPVKVLFVGTICVRKNAHGLLRAWASLAPKNAKLILYGRIEDHIARLCAEELSLPSVETRGTVKDLSAAYREADLFVLPSFEEGAPQVTFEAAGFGLPLITSPMGDGGISAQGRDTAYPVDPYDIATLSEALERFISDPQLRADYGARSLAAAPEFDWNVVGRKRLEALRAVHADT